MFDSLAHLPLTPDFDLHLESLLREAEEADLSHLVILVEDFSAEFDLGAHEEKASLIRVAAAELNIKVELGLQPKNIHLVNALNKEDLEHTAYNILKFHPRYLGIGPESFPPMLRQMFNLCIESKSVLYVCTYRYSAENTLNQALMERELHRVAQLDRSVPIVLIHGFTTGLLQASEFVRANENVFLDLSWTLQKYANSSLRDDLRWLMKNLDQKILVGTDWPENSFIDSVSIFSDILTEARLEPEKVDNIVRQNAERVFGNG